MVTHSLVEPVITARKDDKSVKVLSTKEVSMFIHFPCDWTVSKSPHSNCYPRDGARFNEFSVSKKKVQTLHATLTKIFVPSNFLKYSNIVIYLEPA